MKLRPDVLVTPAMVAKACRKLTQDGDTMELYALITASRMHRAGKTTTYQKAEWKDAYHIMDTKKAKRKMGCGLKHDSNFNSTILRMDPATRDARYWLVKLTTTEKGDATRHITILKSHVSFVSTCDELVAWLRTAHSKAMHPDYHHADVATNLQTALGITFPPGPHAPWRAVSASIQLQHYFELSLGTITFKHPLSTSQKDYKRDHATWISFALQHAVLLRSLGRSNSGQFYVWALPAALSCLPTCPPPPPL